MSKKAIFKTLGQLHTLLRTITQPWYVIGTTGLLLSDIDVEPNDIDILTSTQTAEAIKILLGYFEAPVILKDDGKFQSVFSRYVINGVSIEVMGDLKVKDVDGWAEVLPLIEQPVQVYINNCEVLVPSNADQIKIYTLFGRAKDEIALNLLTTT